MAYKKQTILEYALNRLYEEIKNDGEYAYWRAYIDGAKAQKKEDAETDRANARMITDIALLNEELEKARYLLDKHDIQWRPTDLDGEEDE